MFDRAARFREVTIFLLNRSISTHAAALQEDVRSRIENLEAEDIDAKILTERSENPPGWKRFLDGFGYRSSQMQNVSHSAVVLVKHQGRFFAFAFGPAGRHRIDDANIEKRFGLKVVLNCIESDSIKAVTSVDTDLEVHIHRKAQVPTSISQLKLDIVTEKITTISGVPLNPDFAEIATGADALRLKGDYTIGSIPLLLSRCVSYFQSNRYKKDFAFVDKMLPIDDADLVGSLNGSLRKMLMDYSETIDIGMLDIQFDDDANSFEIKFRDFEIVVSKLQVEDVFTFIEKRQIREKDVFDIRIVPYEGKARLGSIPIRECLTTDISHQGKNYLLSMGMWYEVDSSYLATVNQKVDSFPESTLNPFPYQKDIDANENAYNQRLSNSLSGLCLDGKFIRFDGDKIEPCDILIGQDSFIHLKRGTNFQKTSHFLSQGVNAGLLAS